MPKAYVLILQSSHCLFPSGANSAQLSFHRVRHDPLKQWEDSREMWMTPSLSCGDCRKAQFYRLIYFVLISFTWKYTLKFHTITLQMNVNFSVNLFMHLLVILQ